jgi:hypothetical protein
MTTVVGRWELEWNVPQQESVLWAFPLRDFGVTDWRMWPVTGIRCPESQVTLTEGHTLDELLPEAGVRVYLEPVCPNFPFPFPNRPLHEFEHPADAVYVFGSAHFNPTVGNRVREQDHIVTLQTVQNGGVLWPHQVLTTVLHDRLVKQWR